MGKCLFSIQRADILPLKRIDLTLESEGVQPYKQRRKDSKRAVKK